MKKLNWFIKHKFITGLIVIFILILVISGNSKESSSSKSNQSQPTKTTTPTLSPEQKKAQVVAIVTKNTNHFKKLWQDGRTALGTTQYADAYQGLAALNDPNSNASKFSRYKQTENPANDNSMNDAFKEADTFYTDGVSDDNLNNWRIDMIQLSSDMGLWTNDATGWEIGTVSKDKLTNDKQIVSRDFIIVQKDIYTISQ